MTVVFGGVVTLPTVACVMSSPPPATTTRLTRLPQHKISVLWRDIRVQRHRKSASWAEIRAKSLPRTSASLPFATRAAILTITCRAILDMKNQRDKLHQYQRRITILTDKETDIAKQMLAKGDKKRALLALRRKKYQESLLAKTDAQLEQLEQLTSNVEFAQIQKDVVFGLQQGTKVLQEIHAEMGGIEHVEKLMGDTADAIAYQQVCFFSFRICFIPFRYQTTNVLFARRKSAICSAAESQTKTKKKSRTNWLHWSARFWAPRNRSYRQSQIHNYRSSKSKKMCRRRLRWNGRPCWRHRYDGRDKQFYGHGGHCI